MPNSFAVVRRLLVAGATTGTLVGGMLLGASFQAQADPGGGMTRASLYRVAVASADPQARQPANKVTGKRDDDIAIAAQGAASGPGRLFLFIDGTGTSPDMTQDILRVAAGRGYDAVSIAYPNNQAVATLCRASADPDCSGKLREEVLTGRDTSPLVSVAPADAIEPRLARLLAYLQRHHPQDGWGRFLSGSAVDWLRISVAGHSQGAGYAAMIAKRHEVRRMLMISGVADVTRDGQPAPWLSGAGKTPVDREYGLTNLFDPVVPFRRAKASWQAMGLGAFGPVRSVDRLPPPYDGAHELVTTARRGRGMVVHLGMALDRFLPRRAGGQPVFAPAWIITALP